MKGRSVGEIIVIFIAGTVCLSILLALVALFVIETVNPEENTAPAFSALADIIGTLLGLMAGYLAGRTHRD